MSFITLPPAVLAPLSTEARNELVQMAGEVIFNLDTATPEIWLNDRWAPFILGFGRPNAGDALIWDPVVGYYIPTPVDTPVLSQVKIYDDAVDVLEVKRFYSGNTLTNTSGATTATMRPSGVHTLAGAVNKNYRITVDSVGNLEWQDATFTWSDDGGTTNAANAVPVATGTTHKTLAPIPLSNGVYVTFSEGVFGSGDRWDFVAIATSNQLYDLKVDTTTSTVQVGSTLQVVDATFKLDQTVATRPRITYDAGDYFQFFRSTNVGTWTIDGRNPFFINKNGVTVDYVLEMTSHAAVPGVASAGYPLFYAQTDDRPYWQNSTAEYAIPLTGLTYAAPTTKGDLLTYSTLPIRLGVGTDNTVLIADSSAATGLKWSASLTLSGVLTVASAATLSGSVTVGGDMTLTAGGYILSDTADGSDTSAIILGGGGGIADTRGGSISVFGNEYAVFAIGGAVSIAAGNVSTAYFAIGTAATERFRISHDGLTTITQSTIDTPLLKLVTTATNDDPNETVVMGRVATTDATVTTINTITIPASTTVMIHAVVYARRTGGVAGAAEDGAGYVRYAAVANIAGVATAIGAGSATSTNESQAAFNATISVTGATAIVTVAGAANNNLTWHSVVRYYAVSS